MASFTIHSLEKALDDRLVEGSRRAGISKNLYVKNLLAQATGLPVEGVRTDDYQEFCGVWTPQDLAEFEAAQAANRSLDAGDWA